MKASDKDIDKCLEINIQTLIDAGFIKYKEDLSKEELEELKKVIKHAICD
ncbi:MULTISPECIES: hypothetical protein [Clostridium]|nr:MULTISPECIES: hypothetical protein [Clostridium]MCD2348712.1 hypothetical protein [Clostridium guangxiense]